MTEQRHDLRQFALLTFLLLIPAFALWVFTSAWLALPAIGFTKMILTGWMPELVYGVYPQGHDVMVATQFGELNGQLVAAELSDGNIAFRINSMTHSYSIPFYLALLFATQRDHYLGDAFKGSLVLYALFLFGLLSVCLKELMVNLGPVFREQGVILPPNDLIAILYQLNTLILPTLVPVLLWAWQSRDTALIRGLVSGKLRGDSK